MRTWRRKLTGSPLSREDGDWGTSLTWRSSEGKAHQGYWGYCSPKTLRRPRSTSACSCGPSAQTADNDRTFNCSQFVYPDHGRDSQPCQCKFRMCRFDNIVWGSKSSLNHAGKWPAVLVPANLSLRHYDGRPKRSAGQVGERKPRQGHLATSERGKYHSGSPSSVE